MEREKERGSKMEQKKLMKLIILLIVFRVVLGAMHGVTGDQAVINVSVNNVPPEIIEVVITPDTVSLSPCPDTTPVMIEVSAVDDNGADDISSVELTALTDSVGNDASSNLTTSLPVVMVYNASNGMHEVPVYLKCTTPGNSYIVVVSATDSMGASSSANASFSVQTTRALQIDFSALDFGAIDPGNTSVIAGDANMSTPVAPTIKNTGNTKMDVEMKIEGVLFPINTNCTLEGTTKTLTTTPQSFGVSIAPGNAIAADYKLFVPIGTHAGTYTGQLIIEPVAA